MVAANSDISANGRRRGPGRPFAKGASGNPLGRPQADFNLREQARKFGPAGLEKLAELAGLIPGTPAENPAVQVAAIRELLDRGFGKPTLPVEEDGQRVTLLHLVAAREVSAEIERALAAGNGTAPLVIEGKPLQDTQQQKADRQISVSTSLPNLMQPALE